MFVRAVAPVAAFKFFDCLTTASEKSRSANSPAVQRRFCSFGKPSFCNAETLPSRKPAKVLVTGGANGIGRACVDAFVRQGDVVAYVDLHAAGSALGFGADADTAASASHFLKCDVSDPEQVEAVVHEAIQVLGGIDVLVNNVGAHLEAGKPCHEMSIQAFDKMVAINLRSHFLFCKFCVRDAFLKQQQGGAIVNIGSVHGFQNGPGLPAYAACKGGIAALTRQLAVEYASSRIRVNCVVPGTINTPMNRNFMEARDEMTDRSPMRRWGRPQEVANAVLFLAGEQSSFITGQCIAADGGLLAKGVWADNERPGLTD